MIDLENIDTIITHNGVFHADEVFAIAFICIATHRPVQNFKIIRVNNSDLKKYEDHDDNVIIIDIGGGEFDHHGNNNEYRNYSKKLPSGEVEYKKYYFASFGKIVREFHCMIDEISDEKAYRSFDRNFVCRIDGYDNGDRSYISDFSQIVNDMNPVWNAEVEYIGDPKDGISYNFIDAIQFAIFIICKKLEVIRASQQADHIIEEAKNNEIDHIIILEKYVPYIGKVNPDTEYVIFPSNREEAFNVSVMKDESGKYIHSLPNEWYGYNNRNTTPPVKGLLFCHASGFLAVFDTVENALNALHNR